MTNDDATKVPRLDLAQLREISFREPEQAKGVLEQSLERAREDGDSVSILEILKRIGPIPGAKLCISIVRQQFHSLIF